MGSRTRRLSQPQVRVRRSAPGTGAVAAPAASGPSAASSRTSQPPPARPPPTASFRQPPARQPGAPWSLARAGRPRGCLLAGPWGLPAAWSRPSSPSASAYPWAQPSEAALVPWCFRPLAAPWASWAAERWDTVSPRTWRLAPCVPRPGAQWVTPLLRRHGTRRLRGRPRRPAPRCRLPWRRRAARRTAGPAPALSPVPPPPTAATTCF
mmetsp:Transcript_24463/g.72996  ORF Transcript_24463/g.72996 Transcript_24463/m.72996 type:complete len:209 (+) Transcript_24463:1103-1729(+)